MRSQRILVVEDNIDGARTIVMFLRQLGHNAEYAINGYAAVTMARQFRPEVVLLDIGLPGLNGYEVCKLLKAEPGLQNVRIIVISGYAAEEDKKHSAEAGCELHLAKPVKLSQLQQLLDR